MYHTQHKAEQQGVYKSNINYTPAGLKKSVIWWMTEVYIAAEQITKVVFYYDSKGNETKQEGHFSREKAKELGYYKTIMHHDLAGRKLKEERYYLQNNQSAKGYYKGIITFDEDGRIITEEKFDKYGNTF
ncbi:MAG: hypothetical protein HOB38_20215 [Deltaproteobacteria bacterium]|nr:hypothetical protein [Deltaproteobacteria bacterium]